ncbi:MAG: helix-hairpin-helix domain-containing protein [Sediminibacterium sp.]
MKRIIKDYFTFSKKERTAMIILLLLIACFIAAPYLYSVKQKPPVINQVLVDFLAQKKNPATDSSEETSMVFRQTVHAVSKKETFLFDPNIISPGEWKRLGIADKTIRTIVNYRSKGGKFRSAEDIRKIWGIRKEDADRIIPFVQIETVTQPKKQIGDPPSPSSQQIRSVKKTAELDINTATIEEWKALPGIGEVLANRIIKFRERIGGFTSMEQFRKTYGISDSVFLVIEPFLKLNPDTLPKLNLNVASVYDLRKRLAVSIAVAKAIIVHREQNGVFRSVDEVKNVVLMTDTMFQRISQLVSTQ